MNFAVAFRSDDNKIVCIVKSAAAFQRDYMVNLKLFFATQMLLWHSIRSKALTDKVPITGERFSRTDGSLLTAIKTAPESLANS